MTTYAAPLVIILHSMATSVKSTYGNQEVLEDYEGEEAYLSAI